MSREIELLDGEVLCDKCNGTEDNWYSCPKCHGTGKLDWIENARGGKQPKRSGTIFFDSSSMYTSTLEMDPKNVKIGGKPLDDYIRDVLVKDLSERIDRMLLEQLTGKIESVIGTQFKKEHV